MSSIHLLPGAIAEIVVAVTNTRKLTIADRYGLMAAILNGSLNDEETQSIDRILHALRRGRIKVVDELSTLR